jgi:mRNA-degrading endonuclease toxin of MazEF toxin-antitoxin module
MALPDPQPGLVIKYAYLWRDEQLRLCEEGAKDRPCVVVLSLRTQGEKLIVSVAPITHRKPRDDEHAVEIPAESKKRLGLDAARSWIVTRELNEFFWPGPDVRAIGRVQGKRFAYGFVPRGVFAEVKAGILLHIRERALRVAKRT